MQINYDKQLPFILVETHTQLIYQGICITPGKPQYLVLMLHPYVKHKGVEPKSSAFWIPRDSACPLNHGGGENNPLHQPLSPNARERAHRRKLR